MKIATIASEALLVATLLSLTGCPGHVDSLYGIKVAGDGSGGAIALFEDRLGGNIHAQKIGPDGKELWGPGGVSLGKSGSNSYVYSASNVIADGSGGALVAWFSVAPKNTPDSAVYHVNRLSPEGAILWQQDFWGVDKMERDGSGGVVFAYQLGENLHVNSISHDGKARSPIGDRIAPGLLNVPSIASWDMTTDGEGGAIIVWNEPQFPAGGQPGVVRPTHRIFAQRVDSGGSLLWGDGRIPGNGMSVYLSPEGTRIDSLDAAEDGSGGVVLSWFQVTEVAPDSSGRRSQRLDIVAQKLDSGGRIMWEETGVALDIDKGGGRPTPGDSSLIVSDAAGGAIIGWRDFRDTSGSPNMYAQRIDSAGNPVWPPGGMKVSATSLNPRSLMVRDGLGGAIAAYWSREDGKAINVQRIDSAGMVLWQQDGVSLARGNFASFTFSPDGEGGAIVGWGGGSVGSEKAYVQRIGADGHLLWGETGLMISRSSGRK